MKNRSVTFLAGFGACLAVLVVLPPNVSEGYVKAPRTSPKEPSKFVTDGKWKEYTPPPMPK